MEMQTKFQDKCVEILEEWEQFDLLEKYEQATEEQKDSFSQQIVKLDFDFKGGLAEYWERARDLLSDSRMGVNPFGGFIPSVPTGINVEANSKEFHQFETIGMSNMADACFVLVAGGLGERLGYSSIKVGLPLTLLDKELCYLKFYCEYIKAFELRVIANVEEEERKEFHIPLAIMTSGDTHEKTLSLLEEKDYFGLKKTQVTVVKQEKVPALIDNNANFSVAKDKLEIETKPHGHGDVHTLLHQHGVIQKWAKMDKKWIIFFQDTNALVFRAIPSALGVSVREDFDVNSICVPRKPGDAMGGIATLTNEAVNQKITINVEYNQLDPLLKASWNKDGDVADKNGNSFFPGNTNIILMKVATYLDTLDKTQGLIPEFVNPKYKDKSKEVFKSATRLEWMMQDFPKLLDKTSNVGFSCYERWFCYSSVKNNIIDAAAKFDQGLSPEWATTGEYYIFNCNASMLEMIGVEIEETTEEDEKDFQGIRVRDGAKIFLHPSFGVTIKEIREKFTGENFISKNSVLWLEGEDTRVHDLYLDSTLVTSSDSEEITGEYKEKKYIDYVPLDPTDADFDKLDEVIKIRGFQLSTPDEFEDMNIISN